MENITLGSMPANVPAQIAHCAGEGPGILVDALDPLPEGFVAVSYEEDRSTWAIYPNGHPVSEFVAAPREGVEPWILVRVHHSDDLMAVTADRRWGPPSPHTGWFAHGRTLDGADVLLKPRHAEAWEQVQEIIDTCERGHPCHRTWHAFGVGKRIEAGTKSLTDRASLAVELGTAGPPIECSEYGDTDQSFPAFIGGEALSGRKAVIKGDVILHRTVGGRAEWRIEGELLVEGSDGSVTTIKLDHIPWSTEWLTIRVVSEIAAQLAEAQD